MPAQPITNQRTFALAVYNGSALREIGAVNNSVALSEDKDIHFGLNGGQFTDESTAIGYKIVSSLFCKDLGPRIIDVANRGGRVAEYNWFKDENGYDIKNGSTSHSLWDCLTKAKFKAFNQALPITSVQDNRSLKKFPLFAKLGSNPVGGTNRYKSSATTKFDCDGLQMGTRWSKSALEYALKHGHTIHFHLDGLGDLKNLLQKKFLKSDLTSSKISEEGYNYNYNVTGLEFRYLFRHWVRFKGHVKFYNGYSGTYKSATSNSYRSVRAMEVRCPPWGVRLVPTRPTPDRIALAANKHL